MNIYFLHLFSQIYTGLKNQEETRHSIRLPRLFLIRPGDPFPKDILNYSIVVYPYKNRILHTIIQHVRHYTLLCINKIYTHEHYIALSLLLTYTVHPELKKKKYKQIYKYNPLTQKKKKKKCRIKF